MASVLYWHGCPNVEIHALYNIPIPYSPKCLEDLYVGRKEREVRFLEVGAGGFLGIGQKRFLVPVEAVVEVAEEWVAIDPGRTEEVEGPVPFDTRVAPPPAEERSAEEYAKPPYGDTGRATDRPDTGGYGPFGR